MIRSFNKTNNWVKLFSVAVARSLIIFSTIITYQILTLKLSDHVLMLFVYCLFFETLIRMTIFSSLVIRMHQFYKDKLYINLNNFWYLILIIIVFSLISFAILFNVLILILDLSYNFFVHLSFTLIILTQGFYQLIDAHFQYNLNRYKILFNELVVFVFKSIIMYFFYFYDLDLSLMWLTFSAVYLVICITNFNTFILIRNNVTKQNNQANTISDFFALSFNNIIIWLSQYIERLILLIILPAQIIADYVLVHTILNQISNALSSVYNQYVNPIIFNHYSLGLSQGEKQFKKYLIINRFNFICLSLLYLIFYRQILDLFLNINSFDFIIILIIQISIYLTIENNFNYLKVNYLSAQKKAISFNLKNVVFSAICCLVLIISFGVLGAALASLINQLFRYANVYRLLKLVGNLNNEI